MSASLVGSEMCIRDSRDQLFDRFSARAVQCSNTRRALVCSISAGARVMAVSYTHLTLPTICSV
eukprot:5521519-Alexandrium_andersonii.AAC.1